MYVQYIFIIFLLNTLNLPGMNSTKSKNRHTTLEGCKNTVLKYLVKKNRKGQKEHVINNILFENSLITEDDSYLPTHEIFYAKYSEVMSHKCANKGENVKLLIMVSSEAINFYERIIIRQTWGLFGRRKNIHLMFLIGKTHAFEERKLAVEQEACDDLIRANVLDGNENFKTISALEWMNRYCWKAKFMLKAKDDCFVNMPRLLVFIKVHVNKNNTIYSSLPENKLFGHSYLITTDAVTKLYNETLRRNLAEVTHSQLVDHIAEDLKIERINVNNFICKHKNISTCKLHKCFILYVLESQSSYELWEQLFVCDLNCPVHCYYSSGKISFSYRKIFFILIMSLFTSNLYKKYICL